MTAPAALSGGYRTTAPSSIDRAIRLSTAAAVLAVAIHLWLYNTLIVDTFYQAPAEFAAQVVGAAYPVQTLDAIWNAGGTVAVRRFDKGSVWDGDFGFYLAGAIVWVLVGLLCVYTMVLLALSSIALSVLLVILSFTILLGLRFAPWGAAVGGAGRSTGPVAEAVAAGEGEGFREVGEPLDVFEDLAPARLGQRPHAAGGVLLRAAREQHVGRALRDHRDAALALGVDRGAPWGALAPWLAEALKWGHPMRVSRYVFSERVVPAMTAVAVAAALVNGSRRPCAEESPFRGVEHAAIDATTRMIEALTGLRDSAAEALFETLYGGPER